MSPIPRSREEVWRRYDAVEARLTAPLSDRMVDLVAPARGARALDLATGRGEPALRVARRVGPRGSVLCVEPDAGVLRIARELAAQRALENLEFRVGAAEDLGDLPAGSFAAATIRWGLMYMRDPVTALGHVRRALSDGAPLVLAVFAEPERAEHYALPRRPLHGIVPPIDFAAPGPFRYAHPDVIARDLARAGFTLEHVEELTVPVFEGTLDEVVEWCRVFGMADLLAPLPPAEQRRWETEVRDELERRRSGPLPRLASVTRIAVAR